MHIVLRLAGLFVNWKEFTMLNLVDQKKHPTLSEIISIRPMVLPKIRGFLHCRIPQRGDISSSSLKMGRIICELERIYGIKNGGNKLSRLSNGQSATQEELANKLGIDINTYRRSKKILELIPELQTMVDEKQITTSVASRILARLSPTDQKNLILTYGKDEIVANSFAIYNDSVVK